MALQHEDIWKLLGVQRAKFRKIRDLHPDERKRNYDAREVFGFKILLTFVNGNVPGMIPMQRIFLDAFFDDLKNKSHREIKNSIALWHTTEEYIEIIDREDHFDQDDYRLKSISLKHLYKDYIHELANIGLPIKTANEEHGFEVVEGGKKA